MDHEKRIDKSVPFVAVNIAILTVSDSRRIEDDKSGDLLAGRVAEDGHHLADRRIVDPLDFLRAMQDHPQVDGAAVIREEGISGLDPAILDRIFAKAPVLQRSDPPALGQVADDHIAWLFERFAATHILQVGTSPRTLVALSLPTLGTAPFAALELQIVQRMATLLDKAGKADE